MNYAITEVSSMYIPGPRMCNGKKIPEIENGSWKCERNLNKEGDKKGQFVYIYYAIRIILSLIRLHLCNKFNIKVH